MMNAGDTGFMLICTAFVFFMTPGLAFFYGGLVRRKNVVNTMMACGAIMGLSVVMWTLFGYSLAFGGNHGGIIGDLRKKEHYEKPSVRRKKKAEAARKRNSKG